MIGMANAMGAAGECHDLMAAPQGLGNEFVGGARRRADHNEGDAGGLRAAMRMG